MNIIQATVTNGKIEIDAPHQLRDGATVSLMVLDSNAPDLPMSDNEIDRVLRALDQFTASFPVSEQGEDLSEAARLAGEDELRNFETQADKLKRLFE